MAKVICEPAIYWHGEHGLLMAYIKQAAACGVDFFKLQLFNSSRLCGAKWREKKEFFERNYISDDLLRAIKKDVEGYGMQLICTPSYSDAVVRAHDAGVANIKIASGQIIEPMLAAITEFKWKRIFVSTGMIPDDDLYNTLQMITWLSDVTEELIVMHCVSLYPTEDSEVKLKRIHALQVFFTETENVSIGYSDHTMDCMAPFLAIGMGVEYVEKHMKIAGAFGPTIEVATSEGGMATLCKIAHSQKLMFGSPDLKMCPREINSIEHYKDRYLV